MKERAAMMTVDDVVAQIMAEVKRASAMHPTWPDDPVHAAAVVGEEAGELIKAVLEAMYEPHKSTMYEPHKSTPDDVAAEAIQVGAMAVRFLLSLDRYRYDVKATQHRLTPDGRVAP